MSEKWNPIFLWKNFNINIVNVLLQFIKKSLFRNPNNKKKRIKETQNRSIFRLEREICDLKNHCIKKLRGVKNE